MLDIILIVISLAVGGGERSESGDAPGVAVASGGGFEAEPQVPTGKFTTATEVEPILRMTRGSWVALRDYNGEDLLYVTQLLSWRCGLHEMRIGINGAPPEPWPMPPCYADEASPNAIRTEDGLPYRAYPAGSVESVTVELLYDDLRTDTETFQRGDVMMP